MASIRCSVFWPCPDTLTKHCYTQKILDQTTTLSVCVCYSQCGKWCCLNIQAREAFKTYYLSDFDICVCSNRINCCIEESRSHNFCCTLIHCHKSHIFNKFELLTYRAITIILVSLRTGVMMLSDSYSCTFTFSDIYITYYRSVFNLNNFIKYSTSIFKLWCINIYLNCDV